MKKNLFTIAVLLVCMLLMTACQEKKAETPSPTVPAATIPAVVSTAAPTAAVVPDPIATAAPTQTPAAQSTSSAQ